MESRIKIGLIQSICVADKQSNITKSVENIRKAANMGAQVICLQELFSSLYFCDIEDHDKFDLAETIPGPTTSLFQSLAKELNIVIIASLFEKRSEGLYHNTTAVINAGGEYLGIYRKQHIPDDPGFYEKFYFTPGDGGYKIFNTKFGRLGVLICWDQWYPEAARITSLMGAQVLLYPTAIGWAKTQSEDVNMEQFDAWQIIQRSHAIANGVFVVSVNRTGTESNINFWGGSFVSNPLGHILYQAPHDKEDIHVQEIDLSLVNYYRVHWPFLRDRRIDTYSPIEKRFLE